MDLLGTWGKRTQDLLGGPSVASRMKGLDTAQRAALKRGGVRDLLNDPEVTARAADVASNFDFTGALRSHYMPGAYGKPGGTTEILEKPTSRDLAELAKGSGYGSGARVILNKEGRPEYAWDSWNAIHDDARKFLKLPRQGSHYQNDIVSDTSTGQTLYRNLNYADAPPPMPIPDYVRHMRGADLPLFAHAEGRPTQAPARPAAEEKSLEDELAWLQKYLGGR
jgi:hypothetical protein